jgi:abortive infection bacteriophage resistance protein
MAEYTKPWLSVDEQIDRLVSHGVEVADRDRAHALLHAIGYYRLTGYLYPFRKSEPYIDYEGRARMRVLSGYRPETTLQHAEDIINFDRRLRMLVMDGVERIEVAVRMRVGYVLGRTSAFAHEDPACFTKAFTTQSTDTRHPAPSKHVQWLQRVNDRKTGSDEQFVEHFRQKYDDRMPAWALTEILELGHLSVLYRGMNQKDAEEIAAAFGVPTKKLMASWLASLNYVRNVAAHHARLFNAGFSTRRPGPRRGRSRPLTTCGRSRPPRATSAPTAPSR